MFDTIKVHFYPQGIVEKYGLQPQQSGFFSGYDIDINAGVANAVAAAAFNFIASMLPNNVEYFDKVRNLISFNSPNF